MVIFDYNSDLIFFFQETEKEEGWARNYVKDKNLLIAQLGPTGGKKGYGTITGKYGNFVAFCSIFPCSLTVFHRGRKRKSWGRQ